MSLVSRLQSEWDDIKRSVKFNFYKYRNVAKLSALFLTAGAVMTPSQAEPPSNDYNLSGVVTSNEEPVGNARVITSIDRGDEVLRDTTFTDDNGFWNVIRTGTSSEVEPSIPDGYGLGSNFPNPFNPRTSVNFSNNESGNYTITVSDVLGRSVMSKNTSLGVGEHDIDLSFGGLAAGTYIINITGDGGRWTETATLAGRSSGSRGITVNRGNVSSSNVSNKQSLEKAIQNVENEYSVLVDNVEGYSPWDTTFTSEKREHFFNIELEKEPEPTQTYTFQGTITNPDRPLEGATVITRFGEQPRDTLFTNQDGQWIQNREKTLQEIINAGEYQITIKKQDHITKDTTIVLNPEQTNYEVNMTLEREQEPVEMRLVSGNIYNTTTDEDVPNVNILVSNGDFEYSTQAGSDGSYSFEYPDTLDNITAMLVKEGFFDKEKVLNVEGDKQKDFKIEKQPHLTSFTLSPYNISKIDDMGEDLNVRFELPFNQSFEYSLQANQDNNITLEDRSNNPENNTLFIDVQDPNQQYNDFRAIRKPNSHTIANNRIRENFEHELHEPDSLLVNPSELNDKNLNLYVRNATYDHPDLGKVISTSSTKALDQMYMFQGWTNMTLRPSTPDEEHYSEEFRVPRPLIFDYNRDNNNEPLSEAVVDAYKIVAQEIADIPKMNNNDTLLKFGNYEVISYPREENELYQVAQDNEFYNSILIRGRTGPSTNSYIISQNYDNRIRGGGVNMNATSTSLRTMRHEFGEATFASEDAQSESGFNELYITNFELNDLYKETVRMKLILLPGTNVIRD